MAASALVSCTAIADFPAPVGECNPPCPAGQVCFYGVCVPDPDDGDAEVEAGADGDADAVRDTQDDARTPDDTRPDVDAEADARVEGETGDATDEASPRNTGEPCADASECTGPNAQCFTSVTMPVVGGVPFPGGYCTSDCGPEPDPLLSCGPGSYCLDASAYGVGVWCVETCSSSPECREAEGYVCSNFYVFPVMWCAPSVPAG